MFSSRTQYQSREECSQ